MIEEIDGIEWIDGIDEIERIDGIEEIYAIESNYIPKHLIQYQFAILPNHFPLTISF